MEMLIYALPAGLFFYSFLYLRWARIRSGAESASNKAEQAKLLEGRGMRGPMSVGGDGTLQDTASDK